MTFILKQTPSKPGRSLAWEYLGAPHSPFYLVLEEFLCQDSDFSLSVRIWITL